MQQNEMGGKAQNLIILQDAGYNVPEFLILNAAEVARGQNDFIIKIKQQFPYGTLFAVRSSAAVEDSLQHSFAGQFNSYLNVPFVELEEKIKAVIDSKHNENVQQYQQKSGLTITIEMSVVVQKMVAANKAGVAFGANPINNSLNEKVISVVKGLANSLVNGTASGEQYLIRDNEIIERGNLLNEQEIQKICATLDELKMLFQQVPQDIEFAFENGQFYLLQSRPITTLNAAEAEEIIWDNSNIVESYPSLTLPLTFSFIEKMYESVYRQFSLLLGISEHKVAANAYTFKNMLGLLNGRVYYNLNSWFRSLALLPGYSLNADFMQKMMGVKEPIDMDFSEPRRKKISEYLSLCRALIGLIGNLKNARKGAQKFIVEFDEVYEKFDQTDFNSTPINQIIEDYQNFENLMVQRWKAPLVNDLFAMIYFGLLQKMTAKIAGDLHNKLIAGSHDIITTEPMKLLPRIAQQISENETLYQLFLSANAANIWEQLNNGKYATELNSINQYIERWGDRSLAELKLETVTYRQQPVLLIAILKNYVAQKIFTSTENNRTQILREDAEREVKYFYKNQWLKRLLFVHVLTNARYFVSNRENLRYYRTKAFGMVRRMMLALDKQLLSANIIEQERDIFYLKIEEIIALKKNLKAKKIKSTVESRRAQYPFFEQHPLPQRLKTKGKQNIIFNEKQEANPIASTNLKLIKGTPCSAGIIASKVLLIKSLAEGNNLKQSILATYSTDPGWVVLFPTCSGILTERGSMLSHAAIVSREMGIPCIVGIENLMSNLKNGDEIIMNGATGVVNIISSES